MKKFISNRVEEKDALFCFCCFLLLLLLLLFFFNEYETMNFSECPGINALKTSLTM